MCNLATGMASDAAKKASGAVDSLTSKIDALLINAKNTRRRSSGAGRPSSSSAEDGARTGSGTPARSGSGTPGRSAGDGNATGDRSFSPAQTGFAPTSGVPAPLAVPLRLSSGGSSTAAAYSAQPSASPSPQTVGAGPAERGALFVSPETVATVASGGPARGPSAVGFVAEEPPPPAAPTASALGALIEQAAALAGVAPGEPAAGEATDDVGGGGGSGDVLLVTGPDGGVVAVRTMGASYAVQVRCGAGVGWGGGRRVPE